ncbi:MAG TPA: DUF58 domain-containing protein [Rhodocyclaceae bacterium]|nr:DUF58 domain-containing protein [Rhodocyclaceae bacterium]
MNTFVLRPGLALSQLRQRIWPRHPDTAPLTLSQRRIYVLPTRAGLAYGATLALMLVGSINYNLSLGYALTFLLGGLGVIASVNTFRNLAGLQLSPARHTPGFAGELLHYGLQLNTARPRPGLRFQFADSAQSSFNLEESHTLSLPLPALQRGWQAMPRLTISTTWPLGLVRAWSYARFQEQCLVYPAPALTAPPYTPPEREGAQQRSPEPDDFFGLRPHRNTDLLQHVAWKASARLDEGLLSKQFASEHGSAIWFDLAHTPGTSLEEKIAILVRWILDAHASKQSYGLKLGTLRLEPANDNDHLHACLQALALI